MSEDTFANKQSEVAINTIFRHDIPILFADNVNIDHEGDRVILNFCSTLPGWEKRTVDGAEISVKQAPVFTRIALTEKHFRRFIATCNYVIDMQDAYSETENNNV